MSETDKIQLLVAASISLTCILTLVLAYGLDGQFRKISDGQKTILKMLEEIKRSQK